MDRRKFIGTMGLAAAAGATLPAFKACAPAADPGFRGMDNVKESYQADLLVVGGGPAGVCAAVAAARKGVKVLLADSGNCLGGMGTKGLVGPFMTCYDAAGENMIIRGLFEEIVDRLIAEGGALHPSKIRHTTEFTAWITEGHDHVTPFDPEILKKVYDRICAEAGVKVLFHAGFVAPIMKGRKIGGAILLTPSGLEAARAKMVIDATGDGTVAFRAGAPCVFGDPESGRVQPASLFFRINNVDTDCLIADVVPHLPEFRRVNGVSYRCLHWRVAEAEAAGEWDLARKSVNIWRSVEKDQWVINCTRIHGVDATDCENLSAAEVEGRRQVEELMNFFHLGFQLGLPDEQTMRCSPEALCSMQADGLYVLLLEHAAAGQQVLPFSFHLFGLRYQQLCAAFHARREIAAFSHSHLAAHSGFSALYPFFQLSIK